MIDFKSLQNGSDVRGVALKTEGGQPGSGGGGGHVGAGAMAVKRNAGVHMLIGIEHKERPPVQKRILIPAQAGQ